MRSPGSSKVDSEPDPRAIGLHVEKLPVFCMREYAIFRTFSFVFCAWSVFSGFPVFPYPDPPLLLFPEPKPKATQLPVSYMWEYVIFFLIFLRVLCILLFFDFFFLIVISCHCYPSILIPDLYISLSLIEPFLTRSPKPSSKRTYMLKPHMFQLFPFHVMCLDGGAPMPFAAKCFEKAAPEEKITRELRDIGV